MSALSDLEDLYPRLVQALLPSGGRSTENSSGFAKAEKKRLPFRVEVHDLLARIETEVRELAVAVCDALGSIRCIAFPVGSARGVPIVDPRTLVAFATLDRYWHTFEEQMPEMAAEVDSRLARLAASARRMVGMSKAPVPLVTPCPSCGEPTIFRLETEDGSIAVCGNPEDRDPFDRRRQWTEVEWEEANDPRFCSSVVSR